MTQESKPYPLRETARAIRDLEELRTQEKVVLTVRPRSLLSLRSMH